MNIQKKIAITFGGAVLAACVTVGGLAAANASTPTPAHAAAAAKAAATAPTPVATTTAAAPAPATAQPTPVPLSELANHPSLSWDAFVKTLNRAQQESLLANQETKLAQAKQVGIQATIDQLNANISALKTALGE